MVATAAIGEWGSATLAALTLLTAIWRLGRKVTRGVEHNLTAIRRNSEQNEALSSQIDLIKCEQERLNNEGSLPVRRVLRKLEGEVVPKLDEVQRTVNGS